MHVLTLRMEMLNALIDAGIPESMLHADLAESETITSRLAGDEVGVRAHMLELRKATWEAARRSYERVDRAAEDLLPRRLHDVCLRLRRNAGRRQSTAAVKRGGSSGRSSSSAGCLSTTNTRSASTRTIPGQHPPVGRFLLVAKAPIWPGEYPEVVPRPGCRGSVRPDRRRHGAPAGRARARPFSRNPLLAVRRWAPAPSRSRRRAYGGS